MARAHDNHGGKHGGGLAGKALVQQLRREREREGMGEGEGEGEGEVKGEGEG